MRKVIPDGHLVYGSAISAAFVKETHNNIETLHSDGKSKTVFSATNLPKIELDLDYLPAAAETYCISSNPNDYVLVSLPIVTVDVPNRNLQAFPLEEVAHFDNMYGMLVYQTFKAKACFENHENQDPTKAKGIIVDSSMQYVPKYNIWKINIITLWDRTKDARLAKGIEKGKYNGFSMGASVTNFVCSVCGKLDNMDSSSCDHMKNKGRAYGEDKRLAYQLITGACFFENSAITNSDPADPSAYSNDVFV